MGRHQHEMLMDHADAHGQGIPRAVEVNRCAVKQDLAPFRAVKPCQDIHQGTFACAVLAKQGVDFTWSNGQRDIFQGDDARKSFADILDLQKISHES
jgi:hypothetical protein